jgi:RNA polymerase sigma-70 factor (ECF subfamily)
VKTWIFAILKNKIVDLIRLQVRTTNVSALSAEEESLDQAFESLFKTNAHWSPGSRPSNWGDPEESLREQRFWEVFDACLKHLPANTARVFMMREFLEFETAEVCQELSLTTSNCNVILHRARNGLRRCLESNWFSAGEQPC